MDIKDYLEYNSRLGIFTWVRDPGFKPLKNTIAGSVSFSGYIKISFQNKMYYAHRLAWYFSYDQWPNFQIDHINGNRQDNRISNLREANASQNQYNRGIPKNNESGFKGVYYIRRLHKWKAEIRIEGKLKYLGLFNSPEEASKAYKDAARELHGKFFRN